MINCSQAKFVAIILVLLVFNSREAIAAIFGEIVVFLQFKEFELYWEAVFFS